ncbi:MAG: acetate/propionate family kinase [Pirellulaceae bacterium]|nr:acetate/propionate family kinase [Planctomycetales bacterium]
MAERESKILVANLGSTSFKYRLFDMSNNRQMARGSVDRIGGDESTCKVEIGEYADQRTSHVPDHAAAVRQCLEQLTDPEHGCIASADEVSAIGFKAVHGGRVTGVQRVDQRVLDAMEEFNQVAPAHNPPYVSAMRRLAERFPDIPLVAAFETGFHATIPPAARHYAVPLEWSETLLVQRWGFHGASHRFIAERSREVIGPLAGRVISCHLGGSSSLCAIQDGQSVATTMGMSPQSGLPQNNRVGDFDPFALPWIMSQTGMTLDEVLQQLANQSGLAGLSGTSGDIRDLERAIAEGSDRAQLALDVYVYEIRRHLGGLLVQLGGADAIVFTGGIGENGRTVREGICRGLSELGIELDQARNGSLAGEGCVSSDTSRIALWVIPTNEELIVARQVAQWLHEQDN